jgi:superfamily II DNA or RNA helicase
MFTSHMHPFSRRLLAEEMTRRKPPEENRCLAAAQRQGRIDPNPHQIDAVVFALKRIPDGGCILADEVGLGKTIEAGLVIAQLLAEGMQRILLIVPKSLVGQWQTELSSLFGIELREGAADPEAFVGNGVFIVHREFAGGLTGAPLLSSSDPFDLVVIDEAHEIFAGIHKRFDKEGEYKSDSKDAQIAGRVRDFLEPAGTPVLLLTATPIQNHLVELWGLVQYVERTNELLGDLPTFRELFCSDGDRTLHESLQAELRRRLATVQQRTLRKQAQEFLEFPFVERQAKVIEYSMNDEEKAIYEGVTAWLMDPYLCSFSSKNRRLLQIGFHRRMGSSLAALQASLEKVVARLESQLAQLPTSSESLQSRAAPAGNVEDATWNDDSAWGDLERELRAEFEIDEDDERALAKLQQRANEPGESDDHDQDGPDAPPTRARIQVELDRVHGFIEQLKSVPRDSKAEVLLQTLGVIHDRFKKDGEGTGKAIVFTESIKTQDYLFEFLVERGYAPTDITLFRGHNEGPRVREALATWEREKADGFKSGTRPSPQVAVRMALIEEFRKRSRIFISTEAGAKGLNLQFCETLINYDLPWNPQRIEQRIGRVHRYRQKHGVTVFNFLDRGNEAQKLTFEILSQKLDLFGRVLDASDVVLHEAGPDCPEPLVSSLGVQFESDLRRIYQQARSLDEVTEQLKALRKNIEQRRDDFDQKQEQTSSLISTRLDDSIRGVFAKWQAELPKGLELLDHDLDRMLNSYLLAVGIPFERKQTENAVQYDIKPHSELPEPFRCGVRVVAGPAQGIEENATGESQYTTDHTESLYPSHWLIVAAIEHARQVTASRLTALLPIEASSGLARFMGRRGSLVVTRVGFHGFVPVDRILFAAALEDELDPLEPQLASELAMLGPVEDPSANSYDLLNGLTDSPPRLEPYVLEDAIDDATQDATSAMSAREEEIFQRRLEQLDRYQEDQSLVLRRHRTRFVDQLDDVLRRQDRATTSSALANAKRAVDSAEREIERIDTRLHELASGNDSNVTSWRERLFDRRYKAPEIDRVVELDFVIVNRDEATRGDS